MLSRTTTTALAGRSSTMRRLRRRTASAQASQPYCGTNGCASFLDLDPTAGIATCRQCGFRRSLSRAH